MPPFGCDISQRVKHKVALSHSRMWQFRRAAFDTAMIIDNVEVQWARCIGNGAAAAELQLNLVQDAEKRLWVQGGADRRNRIDKRRLGRIWPCR